MIDELPPEATADPEPRAEVPGQLRFRYTPTTVVEFIDELGIAMGMWESGE